MNQPDINLVALTGTIVAPPQHRELPGSHLPVCNLKLSTIQQSMDGRGEVQTHESQINLVLYGPWTDLARGIEAGMRVIVEGQLNVRPTSKTTNSTTTEINVKRLYQLAISSNPEAGSVETWG